MYCKTVLFTKAAVLGFVAGPLGATEYFANPTSLGTGDGSSEANACTIEYFIDNLINTGSAGNTLTLQDGDYTYSAASPDQNRIYVTDSHSTGGTETDPVVFRAKNAGKATIDGGGARFPISIVGSSSAIIKYIEIRNINVQNGANGLVGTKYAEDLIFDGIIAINPSADDGTYVNSANFHYTNAKNILTVDCAAWGTGRKQFVVYESSGTSEKNVFRRCWGRYEGHGVGWEAYSGSNCGWTEANPDCTLCKDEMGQPETCGMGESSDCATAGGPKITFSMDYGADETLLENCIGTWDEDSDRVFACENNHMGIFSHDSKDGIGHQLYGCIAYLRNSNSYDPNKTGAYFGLFRTQNTEGVYIENCLAFVGSNYSNYYDDTAQNAWVCSFYVMNHDGPSSANDVHMGNNWTGIGGDGMYIRNIDDTGVIGDEVITNIVSVDMQSSNHWGIWGYSGRDKEFDYVCVNNNISGRNYNQTGALTEVTSDPNFDSTAVNALEPWKTNNLKDQGENTGEHLGAVIWAKYEDATLTSDPLFPWDMEQRIWEASGYTIRVTKDVYGLAGGNYPADFTDDGIVDLNDLTTFQNDYLGQTYDRIADMDGDGDVDSTDEDLVEHWRDNFPVIACPLDGDDTPLDWGAYGSGSTHAARLSDADNSTYLFSNTFNEEDFLDVTDLPSAFPSTATITGIRVAFVGRESLNGTGSAHFDLVNTGGSSLIGGATEIPLAASVLWKPVELVFTGLNISASDFDAARAKIECTAVGSGFGAGQRISELRVDVFDWDTN